MSKYIDASALQAKILEYKQHIPPVYFERHNEIAQILGIIDNTTAYTAEDLREFIEYGEWIPDEYKYYHCSVCEYEHDIPEYTTRYCPNCGALMEQEDEYDD